MSSTMTFTTSRDSNGTIVVAPKNEADQSATIVLCHGLGDTSQGWEDVAEVCTQCALASNLVLFASIQAVLSALLLRIFASSRILLHRI
jgi:predicted esterase